MIYNVYNKNVAHLRAIRILDGKERNIHKYKLPEILFCISEKYSNVSFV